MLQRVQACLASQGLKHPSQHIDPVQPDLPPAVTQGGDPANKRATPQAAGKADGLHQNKVGRRFRHRVALEVAGWQGPGKDFMCLEPAAPSEMGGGRCEGTRLGGDPPQGGAATLDTKEATLPRGVEAALLDAELLSAAGSDSQDTEGEDAGETDDTASQGSDISEDSLAPPPVRATRRPATSMTNLLQHIADSDDTRDLRNREKHKNVDPPVSKDVHGSPGKKNLTSEEAEEGNKPAPLNPLEKSDARPRGSATPTTPKKAAVNPHNNKELSDQNTIASSKTSVDLMSASEVCAVHMCRLQVHLRRQERKLRVLVQTMQLEGAAAGKDDWHTQLGSVRARVRFLQRGLDTGVVQRSQAMRCARVQAYCNILCNV